MKVLYHIIDSLIDEQILNGRRVKNQVIVLLESAHREQAIRIVEREDQYELTSIVSRVKKITTSGKRLSRNDLQKKIWQRNARKAVVTLAIDGYDRVVGTVRFPSIHVERNEVLFYLMTLARDCDRFEFILTGLDQH